MTIGAVLNVKDDVELLASSLVYHASIGVDCFVICDRGSSESNQQVLEELAGPSNVHLLRQDVSLLTHVTAQTRAAGRLVALREMQLRFAPDWLFVADADEFWVPRSGDLASQVLELDAGHVQVRRFNAALTPESVGSLAERMRQPNGMGDVDIIVERVRLSQEALEMNPTLPWVFHSIRSSFLTSETSLVEVSAGLHDAKYEGEVKRSTAADLLIVHLPFTSFSRFEEKVTNARRHLELVGHTLERNEAWHWRRWAALQEQGALRAEFDRQFFEPCELEDLRRRGRVARVDDHWKVLAAEAEKT